MQSLPYPNPANSGFSGSSSSVVPPYSTGPPSSLPYPSGFGSSASATSIGLSGGSYPASREGTQASSLSAPLGGGGNKANANTINEDMFRRSAVTTILERARRRISDRVIGQQVRSLSLSLSHFLSPSVPLSIPLSSSLKSIHSTFSFSSLKLGLIAIYINIHYNLQTNRFPHIRIRNM